MKTISFTHEEMCSYVYSFDAVAHKYGIEKSDFPHYEAALKYEKIHRPTNLEKHPDMIENTAIIYGDSQKASEYSILYKKVLDKFILQYLGISGLSSLYNEHYMNFEWNLHSDLDFNHHSNRYCRDHFIHEIRNLFMMFKLFEDEYIYYNTAKTLFSPHLSKVGKYASHQMGLWLKNIPEHQRKLFSCLESNNTDIEDYFKRYVIHASSALACLFHDIGYPVAYYFSIKDRILDFIPTLHSLIGDSNFDFNYVNSILQESLLFQVEGKDNIFKRFEARDHGTISAILLLLYFYKTGKIHSLPLEQQTAIELGVLAIYNHTVDFAYRMKKEKQKTAYYYKMQFSLNPISYMLRLCDDVQEWEREYFEIKPISNLLYCPSCKTPLRRIGISCKEYMKKSNIPFPADDSKHKCYEYWCFCDKKFIKKDGFTRRKLVNIKVCDEVVVNFEKTPGPDGISWLEFDFRYDNFKLLRLCTLQLFFTKYRCDEMRSLKRFVEKQSFLIEGEGYQYIFIKHNLTPNPILLKMFILRDFFKYLQQCKKLSEIPEPARRKYCQIEQLYQNLISAKFELVSAKRLIGQLSDIIFSLAYQGLSINVEQDVKDVVIANCNFYLCLLLYEHYILEKSPNANTLLDDIKKQLKKYIHDPNDVRHQLCTEAIEQINKACKPCNADQIGQENYLNYLVTKKKTYLDVEFYCSNQNPLNARKKRQEFLLYASDLYLYDFLNEVTINIRRS
mgnify:CR=1 FL=1